jgi:hypothetical protein
MKDSSEFPQDARARVEAETLRAYAALRQEVRGRVYCLTPLNPSPPLLRIAAYRNMNRSAARCPRETGTV